MSEANVCHWQLCTLYRTVCMLCIYMWTLCNSTIPLYTNRYFTFNGQERISWCNRKWHCIRCTKRLCMRHSVVLLLLLLLLLMLMLYVLKRTQNINNKYTILYKLKNLYTFVRTHTHKIQFRTKYTQNMYMWGCVFRKLLILFPVRRREAIIWTYITHLQRIHQLEKLEQHKQCNKHNPIFVCISVYIYIYWQRARPPNQFIMIWKRSVAKIVSFYFRRSSLLSGLA